MSEKQNEQAVIAWHLVAKNLIKFEGHEDSYKLSDKVIAASDFAKYPLTKGAKVSFEVKDKVVTYLRKETTAKTETKTEEPKAEEAKQTVQESTPQDAPQATPQGDVQVVTIYAVAGTKKVVKFSKDSAWVAVAPELQTQDYTVIGLTPKKRVKVTIVNNQIVAAEVAPEADKEPANPSQEPRSQETGKETTSDAPVTDKDAFYRVKELERTVRYLQNEKQASIEAQAAVDAAATVIGRIAATLPEKPPASKLNDMIKAIAEANFELIQTLKNSVVK